MNVTTKTPFMLRNIERSGGAFRLRSLVNIHADAIRDPKLRKIAREAVIEEMTDLYAAMLAEVQKREKYEADQAESEREKRETAAKKRISAWKAGGMLSLKTEAAFESWVNDSGVGALVKYRQSAGGKMVTETDDAKGENIFTGLRPNAGYIVVCAPVEAGEDVVANFGFPPVCSWEAQGVRSLLFYDHSGTTTTSASVKGRITSIVLNACSFNGAVFAPVTGYGWLTPPAKTDIDEKGLPDAAPGRLLAVIEACQHNGDALDKLILIG